MRPNFLIRQIDLLPVELLGEKITVIGAGAIGSFTVLQLAKLGFTEIKVYDDDVVSDENMNSQFYRVKDIGRPKVEALQEIVRDFTEVDVEIVKGRYEDGMFQGLVIVAVDNMATRKLVFENHELKAVNTKFILDPRMGAETAMLHVVNPLSEKEGTAYKKTLYTDEQAVQENCTAKATMYTVNLLSGLIAKTVKDIVTGATYLKNVSWDIKSFALQSWNSLGANPNLHIVKQMDPGTDVRLVIRDIYERMRRNGDVIEMDQNTHGMLSEILKYARPDRLEWGRYAPVQSNWSRSGTGAYVTPNINPMVIPGEMTAIGTSTARRDGNSIHIEYADPGISMNSVSRHPSRPNDAHLTSPSEELEAHADGIMSSLRYITERAASEGVPPESLLMSAIPEQLLSTDATEGVMQGLRDEVARAVSIPPERLTLPDGVAATPLTEEGLRAATESLIRRIDRNHLVVPDAVNGNSVEPF